MDLKAFNTQDKKTAAGKLETVCGASAWIAQVLEKIPYESEEKLLQAATEAWYHGCKEEDWKEAFTHHPKIGDISELEKKLASTAHLAGNEQSGVSQQDKQTLDQLMDANQAYEKKFGYIFIVHAKGKTGKEMLTLLNDRLANDPADEILIAMGEQQKITVTRLKQLLPAADWSWLQQSQITTHVLDTAEGKPGKNIKARLLCNKNNKWKTVAQGRTNADGRIGDLLPSGKNLEAGIHRMIFDTGNYFEEKQLKTFFPRVDIVFTVHDNSHYHVPLLLSPFGYSTYRGS